MLRNGVISNFSYVAIRSSLALAPLNDRHDRRTELINNLGFNTTNTALLDCVGNLFQVVGLISGGYVASYIPNSAVHIFVHDLYRLTDQQNFSPEPRMYRGERSMLDRRRLPCISPG